MNDDVVAVCAKHGLTVVESVPFKVYAPEKEPAALHSTAVWKTEDDQTTVTCFGPVKVAVNPEEPASAWHYREAAGPIMWGVRHKNAFVSRLDLEAALKLALALGR